ncbi:MAG: ATP phosphoribosyltransferase regulatory subunit [Alphaproteobacteria bacterium]|nr:MAG: ATP phosphoribosyltransferase regulatory subunit [Alphaproteobacteria bacterium]
MASLAPELAAELRAFLAARDTVVAEIAVIQPADPFLDMAGESLRGRIFLTENESGQTLCLRPEFTIPVCRDHVAAGVAAPARYAYLGEVFRQRREGGSEFFQAGIEDLGDGDLAGADARSLADALALVRTIAPAARWTVTLGDQAVFEAVVRALGLPAGWRRRLARAFGVPGQIEALLVELGRERRSGFDLPGPAAAALAAGDEAALAAAVAARMEALGFTAASGRSAAEIAARLIEQATLDRARLSPGEIALLRRFLAIRAPLRDAVAALGDFAASLNSGMAPVIAAFAARAERLADLGVDLGAITYDAAFGRPLDYYTGLVFEIAAQGLPGPVVGGGRYDRLLTLLGAPAPVPGVGFSVWLDRLERAR